MLCTTATNTSNTIRTQTGAARDFSVVEKVSYPPGQSQGPIPGPNPCVGPTRTQIRTRIQTLTSDSEKIQLCLLYRILHGLQAYTCRDASVRCVYVGKHER